MPMWALWVTLVFYMAFAYICYVMGKSVELHDSADLVTTKETFMYGVVACIVLAFVTTTALSSFGAAMGELLFLVIAVLCYWYVVGVHEDYLKSKTLLYLSNFSKEVKAAEALGNADVGGEEV